MLHAILNEQGHCLDVRDDIIEKKSRTLSLYNF